MLLHFISETYSTSYGLGQKRPPEISTRKVRCRQYMFELRRIYSVRKCRNARHHDDVEYVVNRYIYFK